MVIAMPAMRMMQMPIYQIIHMIPMRHRLMPAVQPVHMVGRVRLALVPRRAVVRIGVRHADRMFVIVVFMVVVQVAVMQIVHMPVVLHPGVSAPWSMDVDVIAVSVNVVMHMP